MKGFLFLFSEHFSAALILFIPGVPLFYINFDEMPLVLAFCEVKIYIQHPHVLQHNYVYTSVRVQISVFYKRNITLVLWGCVGPLRCNILSVHSISMSHLNKA